MATKICTSCSIEKPLEAFYFRKPRNRHESRCKECCRTINKKFNGGETQRRRVLKKQYGITLETYRIMLENQNYSCAICGEKEKVVGRSLAVDHCHNSGKVRQLLCGNCNQALGKFKDSPELLEKAKAYLIKHKEA